MMESQKGNAKMYERLLYEVSVYLGSFLKKKIGAQDHVADLVQEVLISIHKSRHTYNPSLPFKPWLIKMTQSRLIDYFRKNKRQIDCCTTLEDTDGSYLQSEADVSQLEIAQFNQIFVQLPQDQRDILIAMKINGQSIQQVASEKKMSVSAVKVAAHRAYKAILSQMEL